MADTREFKEVAVAQVACHQPAILRRCNRIELAPQHKNGDIADQRFPDPRCSFLNWPLFTKTEGTVLDLDFWIGTACQLPGQLSHGVQKILRGLTYQVVGAQRG